MAQESKNKKDNYKKVVTRAWKDKKFKEKLLKDPKAALKEMGVEVSGEVQIVEQKPRAEIFVLPQPPAEMQELSDQDLEKIAGGGTQGLSCTAYGGRNCE
jgi:hypothetical protein